MYLTGKIKTLNNTGSPDFNICGQATSSLSLTNLKFKLGIGRDSSTYNIINTSDLSSIGSLSPITYNFGIYDIIFQSFAMNTVNGVFQIKLDVFLASTTTIVSWEKFYLFLEIGKTGYQSFSNTFELYNYDIGNSTSIAGIVDIGAQPFEIILTNNTNNLDSFGIQTRVGSSFIGLRKPFTNQVHFYSMIGTQGSISYYSNGLPIGSGINGTIISEENIVIDQIVTLNSTNCTSENMIYKFNWFPVFKSYYENSSNCNTECANNVSDTIVSYLFDATTTTIGSINGVLCYPSQFMTNEIDINIYNYKSEIIASNSDIVNLTYAAWLADNTQFLNPTDFSFIPSDIGDNLIQIVNKYYSGSILLFSCTYTYNLSTCNWWTVEVNEACQDYTISNCSTTLLTLNIKLLGDDKTFSTITTQVIDPMDNTVISFSTDGVYLLEFVQTISSTTTTQYYSLPIYCNLQSCILNYLNETLCTDIIDNCIPKALDNFHSLIINAHSFFLLINEEENFNYIYLSISSEKIDELYTIKTFIDRFDSYCKSSGSVCLPCNK